MIKAEKVKLLLASTLILIFVLMYLSSSIVAGRDDSFLEIQQKMDGISDDEKEVIENLFVLVQEIKAVEKEEEQIGQEIERTNHEIERIESMIAEEEVAYKTKLNVLKQILRSYQRKGPGSYLEIIMSSENLTMLLRRLNTLRDLTRGTAELLESLDKSKESMSFEKAKLVEKLALIEDKQKQLRLSLDNKLKLKDDMEAYLNSLEDKRESYQEHLANVQQMWEKLKPLFSDTTKMLSSIIEEGNLPEDTIEVTFSIFGIKGSIDEKTFNDIIAEHPLLPEMTIKFESDKMTLHLIEENLILSGKLVILEENTLKFEAEEGSFYGMLLEPSSIAELFEESYLMIDLQPLLGSNTLRSVEIEEENLKLTITPNLF